MSKNTFYLFSRAAIALLAFTMVFATVPLGISSCFAMSSYLYPCQRRFIISCTFFRLNLERMPWICSHKTVAGHSL